MKNEKRSSKVNVRDTAFIAVFGALWGLSEILFGGVLHSFQVPFTGLVMASVSILIAVTGSSFIQRKGSIITMGLIASFMKIFSIGGIILTPVLAIIIEAVILEIIILIGRRTLLSICIAGGVTVTYTILHRVIGGIYFYSLDVIQILDKMITSASKNLNLDLTLAWIIMLTIILIHFLAGTAAGALSWWLARKIKLRLNYEIQ
ncbi:hypothetical protein ACFL4T_04800 [candidate division KSB1 bacterium]